MQRYKIYCEGEGKYYKAVVKIHELMDGEEPGAFPDEQIHFSELIIEEDTPGNVSYARLSYDVDCIIEKENKKHRRFLSGKHLCLKLLRKNIRQMDLLEYRISQMSISKNLGKYRDVNLNQVSIYSCS